jgi:hypothetical protein
MKCQEGWGSFGLRIAVCAALFILAAVVEAGVNDLTVLNNFKKGVTNQSVLSSWTGTNPCLGTWDNIQCSAGNVVGLRLRAKSLGGTVTSDINQLTDLTILELNYNGFTGAMPSLNGMVNLQSASLGDNNFTTIPYDFFTNLPALQNLNIDTNIGLNGTGGWTIPQDITSSIVLSNLSMTSTNLNSIPDFVYTMPSLRNLMAAYNNIQTLPASLASSNIEVLQLNNQKIGGTMSVVASMPACQPNYRSYT